MLLQDWRATPICGHVVLYGIIISRDPLPFFTKNGKSIMELFLKNMKYLQLFSKSISSTGCYFGGGSGGYFKLNITENTKLKVQQDPLA